MERRGFGFSLDAKKYVHNRAGNRCEYGGGECPSPNTGRVNHITGAFEGFLKGANPQDIRNPDMNATMECNIHEQVHDAQERLQIDFLKGERVIYERKIGGQNRRNQSQNRRRFYKKRR